MDRDRLDVLIAVFAAHRRGERAEPARLVARGATRKRWGERQWIGARRTVGTRGDPEFRGGLRRFASGPRREGAFGGVAAAMRRCRERRAVAAEEVQFDVFKGHLRQELGCFRLSFKSWVAFEVGR